MAHRTRVLTFSSLFVVAVAIGVGLYFTAQQDQPGTTQSRSGRLTPIAKLVDQQPLQTAQQLDKAATTREEARYSRNALNIADHEVDLAFTSALRNARLHPAAENAETKQLHDRVRQKEAQVTADQDQLTRLKASAAIARGTAAEDLNDRIQFLSAEFALHQDELDDAKRALMRAGGDDESRIQRVFALHETSQHNDPQSVPFQQREAFQVPGTTLAQLRLIWQLREKRSKLWGARDASTAAIAELEAKYDALQKTLAPSAPAASVGGEPSAIPGMESSKAGTGTAIAKVQKQSEDRKLLSEYDQRIQDHQQLVQTYNDWSTLLNNRMKTCLHAVLQGLLWIVAILALVILGDIAVDRLSLKLSGERRRMATMRLLGHFIVQALGIVFIVFVLLGPPSNLSTVVALTGAGLTVALKDFIVAFFGWFVLMGKNGIRVGDWVEINGIGGEVVEIGLLRTVLLETGNWADSGHPTGRRVTFVNSFAIEGHYFNFSTSGQWLWDNLEVLVPAGQDPYPITDAVLALVKHESEQNARQAEKEWTHATRDHVMQSFSAEPALSLRPSPLGTNVIVRYITRANERYATRTRLYQHIVEMLHRKKASDVQVKSHGSE